MDNLVRYNGIPVFEVGFNDFTLILDARENNKRLLSKTIMSESLQDYYKKERRPEFYIVYSGVRLRYPR